MENQIPKLEVEIKQIPIEQLESNVGQYPGLPRNPRTITKIRYEKLLNSIKDDLQMLNLKELWVLPFNDKYVVFAGNMRLRALAELGVKTVPCKVVLSKVDPQILKGWAIKDNLEHGEHDLDELANSWDDLPLSDWGLDVPTPEPPVEPEVEFTEELLEEHNYVVLYFDNELDWLNLQTLYPLPAVKALDAKGDYKRQGVGRIIRGIDFINKLRNEKKA